MSELIYLASPFSSESKCVRFSRHEAVAECASSLITAGYNVFSPITHSFGIEYKLDLDTDEDFHWNQFTPRNNTILDHSIWMRVDEAILERCDMLAVLKVKNWQESKGVAKEISIALNLGKPVMYIEDAYDFFEQRRGTYIDQVRDDSVCIRSCNIAASGTSDPVLTPKVTVDEAFKEGMNKYKNALHELAGVDDDNESVKRRDSKTKTSIMNYPWLTYPDEEVAVAMYSLTRYYRPLLDDPSRAGVKMACEDLAVYLREYKYGRDEDFTDEEVNKVFNMGSKKHGSHSYDEDTEEDIPLYIDALGRHILKGLNNIDAESGLHHSAHALANILLIQQLLI